MVAAWSASSDSSSSTRGFQPDDASEETFITEHYWGYTAQRDGSTLEYRVEHPRWKVWSTTRAELDCDAGALYGEIFRGCLSAEPVSCFVADGSAVSVGRGVRLPRLVGRQPPVLP